MVLDYFVQSHSTSSLKVSVLVETQKELQLIERNVRDETSTSEDEDASPDIGHDICLETYSGLLTFTYNGVNWQTFVHLVFVLRTEWINECIAGMSCLSDCLLYI